MQGEKSPIEVFVSYAHEDERYREEIARRLKQMEQQGLIKGCHDRAIGAGNKWYKAIKDHLESAEIILLLISPDYLGSDHSSGVDVKTAMARHAAGAARVIPIILRPCEWQNTPFGRLQALPRDGRPITNWPNRDEAYLDVTRGIQEIAARQAPAGSAAQKGIAVPEKREGKPPAPPSGQALGGLTARDIPGMGLPEAPGAVSTVHGIDVSLWQSEIDWDQVATGPTAQGQQIAFAYIKATEGTGPADPRFASNWRNSLGRLPRGPYHFFHATRTPDEAEAQAGMFIDTVKAALAERDEQTLELPPMVDVEGTLAPGVGPAQCVSSLQRWLALVEQAFGMRPLIYTSSFYWQTMTGNSGLFSQDYKLWVAAYGGQNADGGFDALLRNPALPDGWTTFAIWQNAVLKGIAGIRGNVDRDLIWLPQGMSVGEFLGGKRQPAPPDEDIESALLERAGEEERLKLMLDATLFRQIVADGFAPTSPEFPMALRVQIAQRLDTGEARMYYWLEEGDQVGFVAGQGDASGDRLTPTAGTRRVLSLNSNAGLQRRIRADGYLPTSNEFRLQLEDSTFAAQCAIHPETGRKRVYYAQAPNWSNVRFLERG